MNKQLCDRVLISFVPSRSRTKGGEVDGRHKAGEEGGELSYSFYMSSHKSSFGHI